MLEKKPTVTEVETAFDGFIGRLDMTEKRTSKLEDISPEQSQCHYLARELVVQVSLSQNHNRPC